MPHVLAVVQLQLHIQAAQRGRCIGHRRQRAAVVPCATAAVPPDPDAKRWWGATAGGTDQVRGKRPPPSPELRGALLPLATVCSADLAATTRAVACLGPGMQQGVLNHGTEVAEHLRGLGVEPALLARLLRRCLPLFAMPAAKRAGVLMRQLMGLGLTAGQAARCFEAAPVACTSPHGYSRPFEALASLLEAGSVSSTDGRQQLADLLAQQPQAAALLVLHGDTLREHVEHLQQLGLTLQELVAAVRKDALLLAVDPQELQEQQAVLREDLGADCGVFAALLLLEPSAVVQGCAHDLRQRVGGLVRELGPEDALATVCDMPTLLTIDDAWATYE